MINNQDGIQGSRYQECDVTNTIWHHRRVKHEYPERSLRPLPSLADKRPREVPAYHQYRHVKKLNSGGEGTTVLVEHRRSRKLVAVKSVHQPEIINGVPKEAFIFSQLDHSRHFHPNIIVLEHWNYNLTFVAPFAEYWLEYCEYGDLCDMMGRYLDHDARIPEMLIFHIYLQMASALEYLHEGFYVDSFANRTSGSSPRRSHAPGIVHRDVKPDNILVRAPRRSYPNNVADGRATYPDFVLGDFGHATLEQFTYATCGTPSYSPPEIPRKGPKGDVYSLGAVIHCLIHEGDKPIGPMPSSYPQTSEGIVSWEKRPEARSPKAVPSFYSVWLEHAMMFALKQEAKRPYASLMVDILEEDQRCARMELSGALEQELPLWAPGD